jgi:hypothetical protein
MHPSLCLLPSLHIDNNAQDRRPLLPSPLLLPSLHFLTPTLSPVSSSSPGTGSAEIFSPLSQSGAHGTERPRPLPCFLPASPLRTSPLCHGGREERQLRGGASVVRKVRVTTRSQPLLRPLPRTPTLSLWCTSGLETSPSLHCSASLCAERKPSPLPLVEMLRKFSSPTSGQACPAAPCLVLQWEML